MKVIVTGSNGLVGSALVRQCIANAEITKVFALTRKPLPDDVAKSPKVAVILHDDFSAYPQELLSQLAGAEGCLWWVIHLVTTFHPIRQCQGRLLTTRARAIGGRAAQFPNLETYRKVQVDYTVAAAKAFLEHLVPRLAENKQFRFVFCSGKFAEWDQEKSLHFMADTRRVKVRGPQGPQRTKIASPR